MTIREPKQRTRLSEWRTAIQQQKASGQSVKQWCEENNCGEGKYYYWLKQVRQEMLEQGSASTVALVQFEPECLPARLGVLSPSGQKRWCRHTVEKMLENEKYYGAVCIGKTYHSSDVAAKRKENKGEHDLVWWFDHHEPIFLKETYALVAEEKARRSNVELDENGVRKRKSTRYSSRRTSHPHTPHLME